MLTAVSCDAAFLKNAGQGICLSDDPVINPEDFSEEPQNEVSPRSDGSTEESGKSFFNDFNTVYKAGYLKEIEELYNTASIYQNLKAGKRFSDLFSIKLNFWIEYAKREQVGIPDVKKWYDNTVLSADFDFNKYNKLSLFGGGSISDSVFTSYGFTYIAGINAGEVDIKNSLTLAYDYFYYWNQVGQNYANDNIELKYKNFTLHTGFFFGVVDFNYVDGYDEKARNPNTQFSADIQYKILDAPVWVAGIGFNTRDFKYYSPLYYSPQDRKITGGYSYLFKQFSDFYAYFGSGARVDNNGTFIWDVDAEAGYDHEGFGASLGISRYNDPFYTSYNSFLNITKEF